MSDQTGRITLLANGTFRGKIWEIAVVDVGVSTNGDRFTEEVLADALPLFENLPLHAYQHGGQYHHTPDEVHVDHPGGVWKNRVGYLKNPRIDTADGKRAIIGEFHARTKEIADGLLADAEAGRPPQISVDLWTKFKAEADGTKYITKVIRADSADFVDNAAAGGRFLRLVASAQPTSGDNMPDDIRTTDGLRGAHPELVARIVEQAIEPEKQLRVSAENKVKELDARAKEFEARATEATKLAQEADEARVTAEAKLKDQGAELAALHQKARIDTAVGASKLTKDEITAVFRRTLESAKDDAELKELIADREKLVKAEGRTKEEAVVEITGHGTESPAARSTSGDNTLDMLSKAGESYWKRAKPAAGASA